MTGPPAAARPLVPRLRAQLRRLGFARHVADGERAGSIATDAIAFRCNLCGAANRVASGALDRERPSCATCNSNVRFRAIARLVVRELTGGDCALPDLAPARQIRGLGLSDADAYALPFADKFDYVNTYFHAEPRLDVANADVARWGRRDFIVASDVFEHVAPPVARAFVHAHALLKDSGRLIFTVPFTLDPDTVEHFPDLHDWSIEERDGRWRLHNRTADGRRTIHDDLVFHGGPGTTLEMRLFSQAALLREFEHAGFARVRIAAEACPAFGIHWPEPWSVPMVAYR
ncbi:MAG: methyltransferase domain-containing protein [Betaproteobacteria bacterium]